MDNVPAGSDRTRGPEVRDLRLPNVADNLDGTLSAFYTIVDHADPVSRRSQLSTTTALAWLSRELSANDWQANGDTRRGSIEDRNVELLVPDPRT